MASRSASRKETSDTERLEVRPAYHVMQYVMQHVLQHVVQHVVHYVIGWRVRPASASTWPKVNDIVVHYMVHYIVHYIVHGAPPPARGPR